MQPYQEAGDEIKRQGETPLKLLKTGASVAASAGTALAGSHLISKVMPFLNQYIPQDLAVKGLSKIDPRFGKFIDTAMNAGKTFDEVKEFIKEKAEESEEPDVENGNIIEKYSPNLHQYILDLIKNGSSPLEAGTKAKKYLTEPKWQNIIKQIEKDYKSDWASIIESTYGNGQLAQPQQPQQKGGSGQQALMAILQKIQQQRAVQ